MPALLFVQLIAYSNEGSENPLNPKRAPHSQHYFSTSFMPFSGGISFIVRRNSFSSQHRT